MKPRTRNLIIIWLLLTGLPSVLLAQADTTYKVVDSRQILCYNNSTVIPTPSPGQSFYGQDANYTGNAPSYTDNSNGTVTDWVTGLMWQKSPDMDGNGIINYNDKMYFDRALAYADSFTLAGYNDWRLPTMKELYSLVMFYGAEPNPEAPVGAIPFIDTSYFNFAYGDLSAGERIIDAQYASSTIYVSTTMNGNRTMFGVNFADGRIKGYPADSAIGKKYYVRYVRGDTTYGKNRYVYNGNGTITDSATGLMWMKNDNGTGILWENALSYAESLTYAGYTDWRLPNAKDLQSIIDYTRSPAITNSAAIDTIFNSTQISNEAGNTDYPFYWTSTTHLGASPMSNGTEADYMCFGRGMGYISIWGGWIDVHGAGAQRSDPKVGNPNAFPQGRGPQGDAVRIYNYVRLVRGGNVITDVLQDRFGSAITPNNFLLEQNYPNPFNPTT
ncbi:MAG TPA: DUF1566 domain-containing protein, partial [Bacteroidota bacterium]